MRVVSLLRWVLDYTPFALFLTAIYFDLEGLLSRGSVMLMMLGAAVWGVYLASLHGRCSMLVPAFIALIVAVFMCTIVLVLSSIVLLAIEVFDSVEGIRWLRALGIAGYVTYCVAIIGFATMATDRKIMGTVSDGKAHREIAT